MKSALELVAFSGGCEMKGTIALLELAITTLDRAEQPLAAAYADMALNQLLMQLDEIAADRFTDLSHFG